MSKIGSESRSRSRARVALALSGGGGGGSATATATGAGAGGGTTGSGEVSPVRSGARSRGNVAVPRTSRLEERTTHQMNR